MAILHARGVPEDLHKAIRHECVETGESISSFVITAARHELERRGKPIAINEDGEGANDQ